MYIALELATSVGLVCLLGALLFIVSVVLLTVREAVNLVCSALHSSLLQIPRTNATLGDSSVETAHRRAQTPFGGILRGLVLYGPKH